MYQHLNKALLVAFLGIIFGHVMIARAAPSLVYIDPPTEEYFRQPAGKGLLKICKKDDAPDVKTMHVPRGTYFADQGPVDGYTPGKPQSWLLTIMTTKSAVLAPGQKCATVAARVVQSAPPPAHPTLRPVERFGKSDKRYFEIAAPEDPTAALPDLAPWDPDYPSLEATATSDFK